MIRKFALLFLLCCPILSYGADRPYYEMSVIIDNSVLSYYTSSTHAREAIDQIVARSTYTYLNQLNIDLVVTHVELGNDVSGDEQPQLLLQKLGNYRQASTNHKIADVTVLFTMRKLHVGNQMYLGYGTSGPVCSSNASVIVQVRNDGMEDQTLSHELAHTIGVPHDGEGSCKNELSTGWMMAANGYSSTASFSQCSKDTVKQMVDTYGSCLVGPYVAPVAVQQPPVASASSSGGSFDPILALVLVLLLWFSVAKKRKLG